jgi:hypothetical protein
MESRSRVPFPSRRAVPSLGKGKVFNLSHGKAPLVALTLTVAPALLNVAGSLIAGAEKFYFGLGEELAYMVMPHRQGK